MNLTVGSIAKRMGKIFVGSESKKQIPHIEYIFPLSDEKSDKMIQLRCGYPF